MGRGRSTIAMVIASLVAAWLYQPGGPKPVTLEEHIHSEDWKVEKAMPPLWQKITVITSSIGKGRRI